MTNKKISALTGATTPLTGTEVVPLVQSGSTANVTIANLTAGRAVSALSLTLSNGNLTQGTTGTGYNFTANTPAAGNTSQLLNDYQEGLWTPVDQSGASLALTISSASYVKVGKMAVVSMDITFPTTISTAFAQISLPFTINGSSWASGAMGFTSASSIYQVTGNAINGFNFYLPPGSAQTNATLSGKRFIITFSYRTV